MEDSVVEDKTLKLGKQFKKFFIKFAVEAFNLIALAQSQIVDRITNNNKINLQHTCYITVYRVIWYLNQITKLPLIT